MIFYSDVKNLVVNSKRTQMIGRITKIAQFKDGKFETNDPELIEKLLPHFKHDGINYKSLSYLKLRKMAEKKGMKVDYVKKAEIIKFLERSERNG